MDHDTNITNSIAFIQYASHADQSRLPLLDRSDSRLKPRSGATASVSVVRDSARAMSDEPTPPDQEELVAAFRIMFPDATDWAHVVRDDAAWAAFSQPLAALIAPEFVYQDEVLPDHAGETYQGSMVCDGLRPLTWNPLRR